MFLNVSICEEVKIQSKCRWYNVSMLISMNEHAIAQFHRNQWNLQWENYKKCIADINVIFAQRFHLFKKSVRMHNDFQKIESMLAIYIKIECIEFNVYLHLKNISRVNSLWCNCKWNHQIICYDSSYASMLIAMLMTMLMTMFLAIVDRSSLDYWVVSKSTLFRISLCSSESYR